jgi:tetratricopeptide (TPR) repeat protein
MTKRIYILLIALMLTNILFGQFIGRDDLSVSLFYMQKNEIDSAQKHIDKAVNNEELKVSAKTWYYRGFIYKELYKTKDKDNKVSPYRLTAIESFDTMMKIDGKDEFMESTSKILKYLASTLYNDAARMLDPENYKTAIVNYDFYKNTTLMLDSTIDLTDQDVKFKLALASMLNKPAETEQGLDSAQTVQIKNLYREVLLLDADNPGANYNLAILFYNEAADIINNMDYDMDIERLNEIQDLCIGIFLEALPYMKKSYELNYKRRETLVGLSNIYYGLNDMEKSEAYKKELEDLEKE